MIITSYRFSRAILIVGRSTNTMAPLGQLFGVSLETVLENEASGFLVPLLVKLCIQVATKYPTMQYNFVDVESCHRDHCAGDRKARS